MKLGIGTYTYMWSIGLPGAPPARPMRALALLEKARELGVKVVQYGPNLPLSTLPVSELDELLSAARSWNIELELGTRGLDPAHLLRELEFTVRCGSRLLRTVPDGSLNGLPTLEPEFRRAGVRLAMENSLIPSAELAAALHRIGSPWLGITLDTVNSLAIPEGTREVAAALAPFTCCLHVKDFSITREWHMMGFRVEGRPAGKGQLDVPWLLRLLREAGAHANAILELWPPPQADPEQTIALEHRWAAGSVAYLRTLIEE